MDRSPQQQKPTTGPWAKVKGRGRPMYLWSGVLIDTRFRSSYLGGGRRGSTQQYWVEYGDLWRGPFDRLKDAKAYVSGLLNAKARA